MKNWFSPWKRKRFSLFWSCGANSGERRPLTKITDSNTSTHCLNNDRIKRTRTRFRLFVSFFMWRLFVFLHLWSGPRFPLNPSGTPGVARQLLIYIYMLLGDINITSYTVHHIWTVINTFTQVLALKFSFEIVWVLSSFYFPPFLWKPQRWACPREH